MSPRDHDGLYVVSILSAIRSMKVLDDQSVLDIVSALLGRFSAHEDEGVPGLLTDCVLGIEREIERTAKQDNARDWHHEHTLARERAERAASSPI